MNPKVTKVVANNDYTLTLTFDNNEIRLFDVKPFLSKGIFKELNDINLFKTVKAWEGTIQWIHEQDLCHDTLYLESVFVNIQKAI